MQISNANNTKIQVHKGNPIKGVLVMGQLKSKPPAPDVKVTDVNPTRILAYVYVRGKSA